MEKVRTFLRGYLLAPTRVISGSADGNVIMWDPETKEPEVIYSHEDFVLSVSSFFHEGRWKVISGSHDKNVVMWDPEIRKSEVIYSHEGSVYSVSSFFHEGRWKV